MFANEMLDRFAQESPVCVMTRATLENVLSDDCLNEIFDQHAERQYCRELTFASCAQLMAMVVTRIRPSVNAAYKAMVDELSVSVRAVYDKLKGIEPSVTEAMVRKTASDLGGIIDALGGAVEGPLPGYDVRIVDGNHLGGTEHRIMELRSLGAAALPGQSLPILDPQRRIIEDVVMWEDGHSHERLLLPQLLEKVRKGQCWVADRAYSTKLFLFGIVSRKSHFVIRQHASLQGKLVGKRKRVGVTETGVVFEQAIEITNDDGTTKTFRRVTIDRYKPTKKGEKQVHILTNLPKSVSAVKIVDTYTQRWTIENAFQDVTVNLRCELNTLGYPDAALFGFGIALLIYNVLSVVQAAIRSSQTQTRRIERNLSLYAIADEVAGVWRGLEIAVRKEVWIENFAILTTNQLARMLKKLARHVDLVRFTTHKWSPKKKQPKRKSGKRGNHVSTQRILANRSP